MAAQLPLPEQANDLLAAGICPDCTMPGMKDGPRGGINQNVACPTCGAEFNVTRWDGEVVMAHRNSVPGKPDEERLRRVFGIQLLRSLLRVAREAYSDPTFPERACDHCGKPYRGPAVYCSLECAHADAGAP